MILPAIPQVALAQVGVPVIPVLQILESPQQVPVALTCPEPLAEM
jgi:hypothetical protein